MSNEPTNNENDDTGKVSQVIYQRWKARFFVCAFLLVLSFSGMVVTSIKPSWGWNYWRVLAVIYTITCLWLNFHLKRSESSGLSIGKELLHWLALLIAVYMVAILENTGIFGNLEAGITVLAMLSLTVFLAGLYIDSAFIILGIVLAIFVVLATLVEAYLTVILIPAGLIALAVLFLVIKLKKQH